MLDPLVIPITKPRLEEVVDKYEHVLLYEWTNQLPAGNYNYLRTPISTQFYNPLSCVVP